MTSRTTANRIVFLFIIISMYFLWPTLVALKPKVVQGFEKVKDQINNVIIGSNNNDEKLDLIKGDDISLEDLAEITPAAVALETNNERAKEGLPPLVYNEKLAASALIKVNDMLTNQYFEHESPAGKDVSDLGNEVHYSYITMGENLAMGNFKNSNDVVVAWMESPGHRANILNSKYREIGVAAAKGIFEGREVWMVVQHFGSSRNQCPSVNQILKREIEKNKNAMLLLEEKILKLKHELEQSDAAVQPDYNEKVKIYNGLVNEYGQLSSEIFEQITKYNDQVKSFNSCLSKFQ